MDRRILKTKKSLKEALLTLLKDKDIEAINTTQICETAMVSRNTFYNYYADKYALLEDCFSDYEEQMLSYFDHLQQTNNPDHDVKKSFLNLINTFFDTADMYSTIPILSSFDLIELYYRSVMHILEKYESKYPFFMNPSYDQKQLNSFLVLGFWGFMHGNQKMSHEEVKERTQKLVLDLLDSPIFGLQK